MRTNILAQSRLKELFDYDPVTGVLVRKSNGKTPKTPADAGEYLRVMIDKQRCKVHHLAWLWVHGAWPKEQIDHINRVRTDNRISNLREVSRAENCHNQGKHSQNWTGYTGVMWHAKNCKWTAQIQVSGKKHHLGCFQTASLASAAYQAAKRIYHPTAPTQ